MKGLGRPSSFAGSTMGLDRAQLIRRTAYFNATRRPKECSEVDERYNKMAVQLFIMIRCIDYAVIDLGLALESKGMLRHNVKRNYRLASEATLKVHSKVCNFFKHAYAEQLDKFSKCADGIYAALEQDLRLNDLEKAYNLMLYFSRLIEQRLTLLEKRYDFSDAKVLTTLPSRYFDLDIKDYALDSIVKSYFK